MPHDFNPFTEQVVIEYFVGRKDQLRLFRSSLSGLSAGIPSHMYIAGIAGTGKTYYLGKILEIAEAEGFLAVQVVLTPAPNSSAYEQIMTILRTIVIGIERGYKGGPYHLLSDFDSAENSKYFYQPRINELNVSRIRQDFETIAEFMREAGIPGAVLCIDEGQRIHGHTMSVLKNALRPLKNFLIVLSLRLVMDDNDPERAGRDLLNSKAEAGGDMGASSFYVSGITLGPFETEEDAAECIKRRLLENTIQFDDEVVTRIARIGERKPRDLVSLASHIYAGAARNRAQLVNVEMLEKVVNTRS